MTAGFIAEQVVGYALLACLLAFVGHLLWVPFRDSRDGRPWLLHGARTAALIVCCVLVLPFLVDFAFTGGQVTLGIVSSLLVHP